MAMGMQRHNNTAKQKLIKKHFLLNNFQYNTFIKILKHFLYKRYLKLSGLQSTPNFILIDGRKMTNFFKSHETTKLFVSSTSQVCVSNYEQQENAESKRKAKYVERILQRHNLMRLSKKTFQGRLNFRSQEAFVYFVAYTYIRKTVLEKAATKSSFVHSILVKL